MPNSCFWPQANTLARASTTPRLDTLFLALPVSWRGTIAQYVGRLHRLHDGKHEVRVYDYADLNVPMLAKMFDRRCQGYEAVGYTIQLPGSAVAGWPAEVPLPVDPEWKSVITPQACVGSCAMGWTLPWPISLFMPPAAFLPIPRG
jgi:hypothetical protein